MILDLAFVYYNKLSCNSNALYEEIMCSTLYTVLCLYAVLSLVVSAYNPRTLDFAIQSDNVRKVADVGGLVGGHVH